MTLCATLDLTTFAKWSNLGHVIRFDNFRKVVKSGARCSFPRSAWECRVDALRPGCPTLDAERLRGIPTRRVGTRKIWGALLAHLTHFV